MTNKEKEGQAALGNTWQAFERQSVFVVVVYEATLREMVDILRVHTL
jgi:hypothetical protein